MTRDQWQFPTPPPLPINRWMVIWIEGKKRFKKKFDLPADAVTFGKSKKREGLQVDIVSMRKHFPPTVKSAGPKPGSKYWWCPYCIKWRIFIYASYVGGDGLKAPPQLRCPVCSISDSEFWVRKYNGLVEVVSDDKVKKGLIVMTRYG